MGVRDRRAQGQSEPRAAVGRVSAQSHCRPPRAVGDRVFEEVVDHAAKQRGISVHPAGARGAAILAVGGGALAVHASTTATPTPTPTSSQPKTGAVPAEKADPAEAKEPPEAADPTEAAGGADKGHADPAGANADHQFEGNE